MELFEEQVGAWRYKMLLHMALQISYKKWVVCIRVAFRMRKDHFREFVKEKYYSYAFIRGREKGNACFLRFILQIMYMLGILTFLKKFVFYPIDRNRKKFAPIYYYQSEKISTRPSDFSSSKQEVEHIFSRSSSQTIKQHSHRRQKPL